MEILLILSIIASLEHTDIESGVPNPTNLRAAAVADVSAECGIELTLDDMADHEVAYDASACYWRILERRMSKRLGRRSTEKQVAMAWRSGDKRWYEDECYGRRFERIRQEMFRQWVAGVAF